MLNCYTFPTILVGVKSFFDIEGGGEFSIKVKGVICEDHRDHGLLKERTKYYLIEQGLFCQYGGQDI